MAELLQQYTTVISGPDETSYTVRSYGEERADGTWIGWIEFVRASRGRTRIVGPDF